jgi:hypothetical protein
MENITGEKEVKVGTAKSSTVDDEAKTKSVEAAKAKATANKKVEEGMKNVTGDMEVEVGTAKATTVDDEVKAKAAEAARAKATANEEAEAG